MNYSFTFNRSSWANGSPAPISSLANFTPYSVTFLEVT